MLIGSLSLSFDFIIDDLEICACSQSVFLYCNPEQIHSLVLFTPSDIRHQLRSSQHQTTSINTRRYRLPSRSAAFPRSHHESTSLSASLPC